MTKMNIFQKISIISVFCLILSAVPFLPQAMEDEGEETAPYSRLEADPNISALQEAFMSPSQYDDYGKPVSFMFDPNKHKSLALRNVCEGESDRVTQSLNRGFASGDYRGLASGDEIGIIFLNLNKCIERYNLSSSTGAFLKEPQKTYVESARVAFQQYFDPEETAVYPDNVLHLNEWFENYKSYEKNCSHWTTATAEGSSPLGLNIQKLEKLNQHSCFSRLRELKRSLELPVMTNFFALFENSCQSRQQQCVGNLKKLAGLNKQERQTASNMPESEKSLFEVCSDGLRQTQTCCAGAKACPLMDGGERGVQARYQSNLQSGAQRHGANLCQAQNLTEMTNDYMGLTEKLCVDSVNKCSETCDQKLAEFKREFLSCFFAPDFARQASDHLPENNSCNSEIAKILKAYNDRVKPGKRFLSLASESKDIQDCRSALTAFEKRWNDGSYRASVGQEMTGLCQNYARANPSLFNNQPSVQVKGRGLASNRTAAGGNLINTNSGRLNSGNVLDHPPVEAETKSSNANTSGAFPFGEATQSESSTASVKGYRISSLQEKINKRGPERKPRVYTPQALRNHLAYLKERSGFDPIEKRTETREEYPKLDCIGFCDYDLYGDGDELRSEVMEAAKIPIYDPEEPQWRGDYFDRPATALERGHLFNQRDRARRRSNLRKWRKEKREEEELNKLLGIDTHPVTFMGPSTATEEQKRITMESYKRKILRDQELLAITCLELLDSGKGVRCNNEMTVEEERAVFTQQLQDIREHKDPFYSQRGKGLPLSWEEVLFRPENNRPVNKPRK